VQKHTLKPTPTKVEGQRVPTKEEIERERVEAGKKGQPGGSGSSGHP
jgi:hypothetical protein